MERISSITNAQNSPPVISMSKSSTRHSKEKIVQNTTTTVEHIKTKYIELTEDVFGMLVDDKGVSQHVRRFSWKNHNNISVQIITYGARITSMKTPDRTGKLEDIILGFDDLAGYLYYDNLYLGAAIGRVNNYIRKGRFEIDDKQYWVSTNSSGNHFNGGRRGFDKKNWIPHIEGSKVVLSHVSADLDEGFPGDLFVKITFELTVKNEFHVDMEAFSTKPTVVNLSNMLYFNLAGHFTGHREQQKHVVTINANCFTPMENKFPTGEIKNVVHSDFNFQVPQILGKAMGSEPNAGFDLNFCINRGIDQSNCFVANALHPPTGRLLEVYSNQCGCQFSTANNFDYGYKNIPVPKQAKELPITEDKMLQKIEKLHQHMKETLSLDRDTNYAELNHLITKIQASKAFRDNRGESEKPRFNAIQIKYLEDMRSALGKVQSVTDYTDVGDLLNDFLNIDESHMDILSNEEMTVPRDNPSKFQVPKTSEDVELKRKGMIKLQNKIPSFYKDGRIHGKNNAIYSKYAGICFQTQNYPDAVNHKNFPSSVVKPGECYKHTIVYKFWVKVGNPKKWESRNFPASK